MAQNDQVASLYGVPVFGDLGPELFGVYKAEADIREKYDWLLSEERQPSSFTVEEGIVVSMTLESHGPG